MAKRHKFNSAPNKQPKRDLAARKRKQVQRRRVLCETLEPRQLLDGNDPLVYVLDFVDAGETITSLNGVDTLTPIDVTNYAATQAQVQDAVLQNLNEIFGNLETNAQNPDSPIPESHGLDISFEIGNLGTAAVGGSEYYVIAIGENAGALANDYSHSNEEISNQVRDASLSDPDSNAPTEGTLVGEVYNNGAQLFAQASGAQIDITSAGRFLANAIAHEVGTSLRLSEVIADATASTLGGAPPIMSTPALGLTGLQLAAAMEFSFEATSQPGGTIVNNLQTMTDVVGTCEILAPRLVGVSPNPDLLFSNVNPEENLLTVGPSELLFRFDGSSTLDPTTFDGIQIFYSEVPFSDPTATPVAIEAGYRNFGDSTRSIVNRFSEPLADGFYQIEIYGFDDASQNITALRSVEGVAYLPEQTADPSRPTQVINFELELGGQVIAVVPQPLDSTGNSISIREREIDVYFNDRDLFQPGSTIDDTSLYQLVTTQSTVENTDDNVITPDNVIRDDAARKVTLVFSDPLQDLEDGFETLRLRIGTDEDVKITPTNIPVDTTIGDDVSDSINGVNVIPLNVVSATSRTAVEVSEEIVGGAFTFDLIGANQDIGHRDILEETHLNAPGDNFGGITGGNAGIPYTFAFNNPFGVDIAGNPVFTTATDEQVARFREVLDYWSDQTGQEFVETENAGLILAVGDLNPVGAVSAPGGAAALGGPGIVVMDGAENWNNTPGAGFFSVALHEVGHAIGLGHTFDLPSGTVMGSQGDVGSAGGESVFPGDADLIHGNFLHRPDTRDVDFYQFDVAADTAGTLNIETVAERLSDSSLLDSHLTLYHEDPVTGAVEVVASNDDYFSNDAFISVRIELPGRYFIGVTASGNEGYDPHFALSGPGGISQGPYTMRVDFQPDADNSDAAKPQSIAEPQRIINGEVTQVRLDGDNDGLQGGVYNFWFRTADPDPAAVGTADPRVIFVDKTFQSPPAAVLDGSIDLPFRNIDDAVDASEAGDIIRIVGNAGTDGLIETTGDNQAYEIGEINALSQILDDGQSLEIPAGVTVMVEAGAVIKLLDSFIGVGSGSDGVNRNEAALQVLGIPGLPVHFTSYNDTEIGENSNPLNPGANPGNWGGIEFRNRDDLERGRVSLEQQGIFINYVNHAELRYGGGQVTVGAERRAVSPITLTRARPEISHNTILDSADAAISATPDSFEETTFAEPRFQIFDQFVPDYGRVGPDIHRNLLLGNSTNGVFVRVDTEDGELRKLQVSARFDDTDIVHAIGENILIQGQTGGAFLESIRPSADRVFANPTTTTDAGLANGDYFYRVVYVDQFGTEGLPSDPITGGTLTGADNAIELRDLPAVTGEFVGRRLYRGTLVGGPYSLVAELDGTTSVFVDTVTTNIGGSLDSALLAAGATIKRARPDARLSIDPGLIVKAASARIESEFGAEFYAEGTENNPIILTSRFDDRFGAGGTFDTNDDANDANPSLPVAGDWGGIYTGPFGHLSLDNVLLTFAGGIVGLDGNFSGFNAIEVHQAEARITNSTIEENANGLGGQGGTRFGKGAHEASTIFVVGSQPVIAGNTIRDNAGNPRIDGLGNVVRDANGDVQYLNNGGPAISINANALVATPNVDLGRQTADRGGIFERQGNFGPLVIENTLGNNSLNGMGVRGQVGGAGNVVLNTASVWDDTDIVHILQDEIVVTDVHHDGGLKLLSSPTESLIVKIQGGNAGFTATGRPLDIQDRIGGRLQIVGTPGFPVILTSLSDDTTGAGFDPSGAALLDTNNNGPSVGTPGQWRSVLIDEFAYDRNVTFVREGESAGGSEIDVNGQPSLSQELGILAANEDFGDENIRYGFEVNGQIDQAGDLDVYSFTGTGGTLVWLDIDRTSSTLDSIVELIDGDGNVLALSDNSSAEIVTPNFSLPFVDPSLQSLDSLGNTVSQALPMQYDPFWVTNVNGTYKDNFSTNENDAGFRVALPGTAGVSQTYFVRVRASNPNAANPALVNDPAQLTSGTTVGNYQLNIRLQEVDEFSGTTVQFSDIRFATNGIEVYGQPAHSQLAGEVSHPGTGVLSLGALTATDRGVISAAGQVNGASIQQFEFQIYRDSLQVIANDPGALAHVSATIDLDYADGIGRADTSMYLYYQNQLVMVAHDSNIADDRPEQAGATEFDDRTQGSVGFQDPFIGFKELPANNPNNPLDVYRLVVTSAGNLPTELQQYIQSAPSNADVRLQPAEGTVRLVEDRFDANPPVTTSSGPVQAAFTAASATQWDLGDVTSFVLNGSTVHATNPFTGRADTIVTDNGRAATDAIAIRPDGFIVSYNNSGNDAGNGTYQVLDPATGTNFSTGQSGIQTFRAGVAGNGNPIVVQANEGVRFHALEVVANTTNSNVFMYGVGSRNATWVGAAGPDGDANNGIGGNAPNQNGTNYLYRLDPTTGAAINPFAGGNERADRTGEFRAQAGTAGTQNIEHGVFNTAGEIVGLTHNGFQLFAFSNLGEVFTFNVSTAGTTLGNAGAITTLRSAANPIMVPNPTTGVLEPLAGITGAGSAPENVEGGRYQGLVFLTTNTGEIVVVDPQNNFTVVNVLANNDYRRPTTTTGGATIGASDIVFSNLDSSLWHISGTRGNDPGHGQAATFDGFTAGAGGGNSFYFGHDAGGNYAQGLNPGITQGYDFAGGAHGSLESNPIDLSDYAPEDLPVLYFNYFSETRNINGLDSLRVYVAGDDNVWRTVASNSTTVNVTTGTEFGGTNELGAVGSQYTNPAGVFAQPLYDVSDWRQARVPLDLFAGSENVRIRFEFASAGETRPDQAEIRALPATDLNNNRDNSTDTFTLTAYDGANLGASTQFEFDLGWMLRMPSGASIADGSRVVIDGTVFQFIKAATPDVGATVIPITNATTASQVAALLSAAVPGAVVNASRPEGVSLPTATAVVPEAGTQIQLRDTPGVAAGNVAIPITINMSVEQVRTAMQEVFAEQFNIVGRRPSDTGGTTNGELNSFPTVNRTVTINGTAVQEAIRLYDMVVTDQGPLQTVNPSAGGFTPVDGALPGNVFGTYNGGTLLSNQNRGVSQGTGLQTFNGVFIDDIVIGFAERGEVVTGATGGVNIGNNNNPYFSPTFGGTPLTGVTQGPYQVEIRLSQNYNVVPNPPGVFPATTFNRPSQDTNERITQATEIVVGSFFGIPALSSNFAPIQNFNDTDGVNIPHGSTFQLSNGVETVFFEFVDTESGLPATQGRVPVSFTPDSTAAEIAVQIRNVINQASVRDVLGITASISGDETVTAASTPFNPDPGAPNTGSSIVQLHGHAVGDVSGSFNLQANGLLTLRVAGLAITEGDQSGDQNAPRHQGQILITSNAIRNSSEDGLVLDARRRNQPTNNVDGDRPYPGTAANFPELNSAARLPGVVAFNNLIVGSGSDGIFISGDTGTVGGTAPSPFARIVNNTIYGDGGGTGINITENAAPTVLNNIVANVGTGYANNGSGGTVFGGNVGEGFLPPGQFAIQVNPGEPLFLDPVTGNFYPDQGSAVIDSAVEAVQDRLEMIFVRESVGIERSPILAPSFDILGQLRVDEPTVNSPAGQGGNIFIDRGAIDAADFFGPIARILNPLDNDAVGFDQDDTLTNIIRTDTVLNNFIVQLFETGTGPDPSSVNAESLVLTADGVPLIEGVDYTFGYLDSLRQIRLTPFSGIWRPDVVYEITLNNRDQLRIDAPSGNQVSDGEQFTLEPATGGLITFEYDTGFELQFPQTLTLSVPTGEGSSGFQDLQSFVISNSDSGATVRFEFNLDGGTFSAGSEPVQINRGDDAAAVALAVFDAISNQASFLDLTPTAPTADNRIHLGSQAAHSVSVGGSPLRSQGDAEGVNDGDSFAINFAEGTSVEFQFMLPGSPTPLEPGRIAVPFARTDTNEDIATALRTAMLDTANANPGVPGFDRLSDPVAIENGRVIFFGDPGDTFDLSSSPSISLSGTPGVAPSFQLEVPTDPTGAVLINDGDSFTVSDGNQTVTYELDSNALIGAGAVRIAFSPTDSADVVAAAIADALINSAINLPAAEALPGGIVSLNETVEYTLNAGGSSLIQRGVPGGAIAVNVLPSPSVSSEVVAATILAAISDSQHTIDAFSPGGGQLWFSDIAAIGGIDSLFVPAIQDLAGNDLQANRDTGETQFTIQLGDGRLSDFGDADVSYETLLTNNGARHIVIVDPGSGDIVGPFFGSIVDTETDASATIAADGDDLANDDEDGIITTAAGSSLLTIDSVFNFEFNNDNAAGPGIPAFVEIVASESGLVDAWIDWNGDGNFDVNEQVLTNELVATGANIVEIVTPNLPPVAVTLERTARFRISQTGNLQPRGAAIGGEVEDHIITVITGTPPVAVDDNTDPVATPELGLTWQEFPDVDPAVPLDPSGYDLLANDTPTSPNLRIHPEDIATYTNRPLFDSNNNLAGVLNIDVSVDGTAFVDFTPEDDYSGLVSFTYRVVELVDPINRPDLGLPSKNEATVTIRVLPVNDAPVAVDDVHDAAAGVNLRFLEDQQTIESQFIDIPISSLVQNDSEGAPSEALQTFRIDTLDADPAIEDIFDPLNVGTPSDIAILSITFVDATGVAGDNSESGFVRLTFAPDANGTAAFRYKVVDELDPLDPDFGSFVEMQSNYATVTLEVLPVNDAPVTDLLHAESVNEDDVLRIAAGPILTTDLPGPATAFDEIASQVLQISGTPNIQGRIPLATTVTFNGTASEAYYDVGANEIVYTPPADYFGPDTITYIVEDFTGPPLVPPLSWTREADGSVSLVPSSDQLTATGTIAIEVVPVNDAPTITGSSVEALEDTAQTYTSVLGLFGASPGPVNELEALVLAPINDVLGNPILTSANGGTFAIVPNGGDFDITYTPAPSFFGEDTFTVQLTDVPPGLLIPETTIFDVTVTVRPVNDSPFGADDAFDVIEDTSIVITPAQLLANDRVNDLTPVGGLVPTDEVLPDAGNDSFVTAGDPAQTISITGFALGPNAPAGTTLTQLVDGSIEVVPPADYYSEDRFGNQIAPRIEVIYTLTDNGTSYAPDLLGALVPAQDPQSTLVTATLSIYPVNDPPTARTHIFNAGASEDTLFVINAADVIPTQAIVDGFFTQGDAFPLSFDTAGVGEDLGPDGVFLGSDSDLDFDMIPDSTTESLSQVLSILSPAGGLVSIPTALGGTVTFVDSNPGLPGFESMEYQPPADFFSQTALERDSFTYQIQDNGATFALNNAGNAILLPNSQLTSTGTIEIFVAAVNDQPIAVDDPSLGTPAFQFLEDTVVSLPWSVVLANDIKGPTAIFNEEDQTLSVISAVELNDASTTADLESVVIDPFSQQLIITPAADTVGIAKIVYTIMDDDPTNPLASDPLTPATITLEFLPVNDTPITSPDFLATAIEDEPLTIDAIDITSSDLVSPTTALDESAAQSLQVIGVEPASTVGGTVTFNPVTGEITYRAPDNYFGPDSFRYLVQDVDPAELQGQPTSFVPDFTGGFVSQPDQRQQFGTVQITVNGVNDAPSVSNPTDATALEDTTQTYAGLISLYGATPGPGGETDALTFSALGETSAGALVNSRDGGQFRVVPDGSGDFNLIYTPPADFFGTDQLLLNLTDTPIGNPAATRTTLVPVLINVLPVNDAPLGGGDMIDVIEDETITITRATILANDSVGAVDPVTGTSELLTDAGNAPQQINIIAVRLGAGAPSGTSVQLLPGGNIELTPPTNFYSEDGDGGQVEDRIELIYTLADNGVSFQNTPAGLVPVPDGMTTDATITALVYPKNDPPTARNHQILGVVNEDTSFDIDVSDLVPTQALIDNDIVINGSIPVTFDTAGPGEDLGPDLIKELNEQLTQTLSVFPPSTLTTIDTARGGTATFLDTDLNSPGFETIRYTPPANFSSETSADLDSFAYRVVDNGRTFTLATGSLTELPSAGLETFGTVSLEVRETNDAPEFFIGADMVLDEDSTAFGGTPGVVSVDDFVVGIRPGPAAAVDELDQIVTFGLVVDNTGLFADDGTGNPDIRIENDGTLSYTLAPDANGTAVVTVTAMDDHPTAPANSAPQDFTITVNPVNDPPEFQSNLPARVNLDEDSGLFESLGAVTGAMPGPVTATDEAVPVQNVGFAISVDQPQLFSSQPAINAAGDLTFTPAANANGQAVLTITAFDNGLTQAPNVNVSAAVDLTVTINPVNDPPIANNDSFSGDEDTVLVIPGPGLLTNDTDLDGDPLAVLNFNNLPIGETEGFSAMGVPIRVTNDGSLRYDPTSVEALQILEEGQVIFDTFTYQVRDVFGQEGSSQATVTIEVQGRNDAPDVSLAPVLVASNRSTTIAILDGASDVDGTIDPSTLGITALPSDGVLDVNSDGTVTYTPRAGFTGTDGFAFTVADNDGAFSSPFVVSLTVADPPATVPVQALTVVDTPVSIDVLATITAAGAAVDPTSLRILGSTVGGSAAIQADGTILFTPTAGFTGVAQFEFAVSDTRGIESDATRVAVNVSESVGQNPSNFRDVNASGFVSQIDALIGINHLNRGAPTDVTLLDIDPITGPFLDVNGDGTVSPLDSLIIINRLNQESLAGATGEFQGIPDISGVSIGVSPATVEQDEQFLLQAAGNTLMSVAEETASTSGQAVDLDQILDDIVEDVSEEEDGDLLDDFWSEFEL